MWLSINTLINYLVSLSLCSGLSDIVVLSGWVGLDANGQFVV